jgi:hypothetical protein
MCGKPKFRPIAFYPGESEHKLITDTLTWPGAGKKTGK